MLATIVLHAPLLLFPAPTPPLCQLEVLPMVVLEERVLRTFDREVDRYVRLHRRLQRELPPEHMYTDDEDMSVAIDALHDALVDARPYAQAGALFTPAVAELLTRRIELAIAATGLKPEAALLAMKHGYQPAIPALRVNDRFTGVRHVRVWPALLAVLPTLPTELAYRFVGRDLVIVDLHADHVVDILKNALPPPAAEPASYSALPRETPRQAERETA